jgi:hypothetical protein
MVVDELVLRHRLLSDIELAAVRKAGASNQELILATVIAARTRQAASRIYREVKSGSQTLVSPFAVGEYRHKEYAAGDCRYPYSAVAVNSTHAMRRDS